MRNKFVRLALWMFVLPIMFYRCTESSVIEENGAIEEVVLKSTVLTEDTVQTSLKFSASNFNFEDIEEAEGLLDRIYLRSVGGDDNTGKLIEIWDSVEVFNFLDMNSGIMSDIGFVPIPAGVYGQAVVHMKSAWVVYKGEKYECKVPSEKMTLSFKKPLTVGLQLSPEVLIDIDVSKSFIPVGSKKDGKPSSFIFKPVFRVVNTTYAGRMVGAAFSPSYEMVAGALIQLTDGEETYQTYTLNDTVYDEFGMEYLPGYYSLNGIPAGDYTATASKDGFAATQAEVTIVEGNFTEANFLLVPTE